MTAASGARCDAASGHCLTCSDAATPMRILAVGPDSAVCADDSGRRHDVVIDLIGDAVPGATVLVHAGVAIGPAP